MIFSLKNTLKDDIAGIIEKDVIHPKKHGTFSNRKIKDDKNIYFHKNSPIILCTFMETVMVDLKNYFPKKKKKKKKNRNHI